MDPDETAPHAFSPSSQVLSSGTVLAGRFRIERLAGYGGMGAVYQAQDATTGQRVALKLLHATASPEGLYRFHREAEVLEQLRHPGIVSYVAHATTTQGQPFLVMEWLEGQELSRRLARAPLSLWELLALVRRAAESLAHAHRQGLVHRDLKPSNLFLRGGRAEDVVLLDFGLARHSLPSASGATASDAVVGTPGYMAPEQASSQREIPPAADIFSLGCVLYECLTGKPPFAAPHFAAVMAKILFAEPVPLRAVRPGLSESLVSLVGRMLLKDPTRRLRDADALLEALDALEPMPEALPPRIEPPHEPTTLEGAAQQLVSVLLVSPHAQKHKDETADWTHDLAVRDSLRMSLVPYGAQVELLADGSLVATLVPERGTATDQATLAVRCALTFKERWPEAGVVLATGLGVLNERLPVGDAMERAGRLFKRVSREPATAQVVLDEVTAGLLGPGFQLTRLDAGAFLLRGERLSADESRPLLGKPTPCVGRDQELALLEFTFNGCVEEPAASAVLVTAPPGTGKSRLRHEFLRRIERHPSQPLVLMGRAEPLSMGAASGLLGMALRELCGLVDGQEPREQRERLSQRLSRHLPPASAAETVALLGELCSLPFPDEHHPRLLAARQDPRLMSTQVGRALVAFLAAECAHQPVVLVLEDLHWSDALTVKRVEEVLRELSEQPFLVLALARPEVKTLFPQLWSRHLREVVLRGLSRKAGMRLVREVLGEQLPESFAQRLVELSDGNALFLEELIRMAAEGRGGETPETVLAVLRARLTRMQPGARQVLLAASIFGRGFWPGGVRALLGLNVSEETLARHLQVLVDQEVIEPRPDSHLAAEREYRFRHALVRDVAYGLVSEGYLPLGHRLAGAWLEQWSEVDPRVLATHYELGGQPERALHFYTVAAERLFDRHDMPGTLRCVEAALACEVGEGSLVQLRALQAVMAFWLDDMPRFFSLSDSVLAQLEVGSRLWCWLMGGRIVIGVYFRGMRVEEVVELGQVLRRLTPKPEALGAYTWATACLGLAFVYAGARWELEDWLEWMKQKEAAADRVERAWTRYVAAYFHHLFVARPWRAFVLAQEGARAFRELGMERDALIVQTCEGVALAALGDIEGAVERLRGVILDGQRIEAQLAVGAAQHFLAQVLVDSLQPRHREEAYALVRDWVESGHSYSFRQGIGHSVLAKVRWEEGALVDAERHARQACELLAVHRADALYAQGLLSTILLARGEKLAAREVALKGVAELEALACQGAFAVGLWLALARACRALGEEEPADAALEEAVRCVLARASDIPEPALRERFLREVPAHAQALALARERWGEDYFTGK